ncbi:male sterility protein-domain-containing protein [Gorgonomyces haynaldii]|nr:male sterility protein-domain-containing protein [Gorgonomyces haynaldii]
MHFEDAARKGWSILLQTTVDDETDLLKAGATFEMNQAFVRFYHSWAELSYSLLYQHPVFGDYLDAIRQLSPKEAPFQPPKVKSLKPLGYSQDAQLPVPHSSKQLDITFDNKMCFFLTGASGYLGAFILQSLFQRMPKARVYCLVRSKSQQDGFKRLQDNCKRLNIPCPWLEKVQVLCGDLSETKFGLSQTDWDKVGQECQVIIHNGALVHWKHPYATLRAPNVLGTLTILDLAVHKRLKPVHFVSTTGVQSHAKYRQMMLRNERIQESDDLSVCAEGLYSGYGASKWVAEQLIMKARTQGIPTTTIRLSYIIGSTSGSVSMDDFIWRLAQACVILGKAPKVQTSMNAQTADWTGDLIANIACDPKGIEQGVYQPELLYSYQKFFSRIKDYGYPLQMVDYVEWRRDLVSSVTKSHPIYPLLYIVCNDWPSFSMRPLVVDKSVRKLLPYDSFDHLIPKFIDYMIQKRALPLPGQDLAISRQNTRSRL